MAFHNLCSHGKWPSSLIIRWKYAKTFFALNSAVSRLVEDEDDNDGDDEDDDVGV